MMKNFFKEIKDNFYRDYKIYIAIIIISFIISFIGINIITAPNDSQCLVIYSNVNFNEEEQNEIQELFSDTILSLEVYYDYGIDTTRFGTTGIMLSDIYILNKTSLDLILHDISDIMMLVNDNYYIKIPENSKFYTLYNTDEELYILINKNSSNISDEHNEVFQLIEYWIEEGV